MPKYGLISETDAGTLEKTIDLIQDNKVNILEIGVYAGETGYGLREYVELGGKKIFLSGIENDKDGERIRFFYDRLIIGNSNEVYNQIENNSQHLIFIDGCHCFAHVVSDFFCYAPKVKVGGYLAFHDTGKHIQPFKDFQHGDKDNPDAYISCRKALQNIGILMYDNLPVSKNVIHERYPEWQLILDEADVNNAAGGICVFRKLY